MNEDYSQALKFWESHPDAEQPLKALK